MNSRLSLDNQISISHEPIKHKAILKTRLIGAIYTSPIVKLLAPLVVCVYIIQCAEIECACTMYSIYIIHMYSVHVYIYMYIQCMYMCTRIHVLDSVGHRRIVGTDTILVQ